MVTLFGGFMIIFKRGDIFASTAQAIVNPVNCVGIMGAGLAKECKKRYPMNFIHYEKMCKSKLLQIGKCLTVLENNKLIVNFPTKEHWRNPSKYEYIESGLQALIKHVVHYQIKSIAIPALGCGLGGLEFDVVKQLIQTTVSKLDLEVELYLPS